MLTFWKMALSYWMHSRLTLMSQISPVRMHLVKYRHASWSLLRAIIRYPQFIRQCCFNISVGITITSSLSSYLTYTLPESTNPISFLALSNIFSAVKIFLLLKVAYALEIYILSQCYKTYCNFDDKIEKQWLSCSTYLNVIVQL